MYNRGVVKHNIKLTVISSLLYITLFTNELAMLLTFKSKITREYITYI
jgi:hypothetical protein